MKTYCQLSQLLIGLPISGVFQDARIDAITQDSREVTANSVFVACGKGREYIGQATTQGAACIICDSAVESSVPCILLESLPEYLGILASRFYGNPSQDIKIIGVTGTNGKTSVSHYVASLIEAMGDNCAIIGTLGCGRQAALHPSQHTTPDVFTVHKLLAEFKKDNIFNVAMEVSSHGLDQGRVDNVQFDYALFTNLSRDHLDYHGSIEQYAAAKKKLFTCPSLTSSIFNVDDEVGAHFADVFYDVHKVYGVSRQALHSPKANILINNITQIEAGYVVTLHTPWGILHVEIPLLGAFNITNVALAVTVLCEMGYPLDKVGQAVSTLSAVPGRMQKIYQPGQPTVVIDYAHTPDALEKALSNLKLHTQGKLLCVFGCGGNRDRGKRPMMLAAAKQFADTIIVTSDNPRFEDEMEIIQDILKGSEVTDNVLIEVSRQDAIHHAVQLATPEDLILVAGKGHETYQEIGGVRYPFDDGEVVQAALRLCYQEK